MAVSFHVGIVPNQPLEEFLNWVPFAEELGFEGVWVADSQSVFRDAFIALTLFASHTEKMKLATGVTNPVTRHPAVLANSFATLDEISGGRAVLGIGVGESAVQTLGLKPAGLKRLEEVTSVLRGLLAGETVRFEGREIRMTTPAAARVPIFFASSGPRSLQLAGRIADGVLFQVGSDPDLVRYVKRNIAIGARQAGRDPAEVRLFQRLACGVSEDRERVRQELKGYVAVAAGTVFGAVPKEDISKELWEDLRKMKEQYDYYRHASSEAKHTQFITDRILDAMAIAGTPEEAVPRFKELIDLGVEGFVLPMTTRDPKPILQMLAEKVIVHFNA
ncbi:MAG: LLM class flavin-dependent oxidoreductase [Gammaproteobacteria bacterium]|nr:LLM class flavin-dependent oxidoreductase [Gammaproteobacteria bacterium]